MSDNWNGKEYIEGEFEILEERDLGENRQKPPPKQVLYVDRRPPYITYTILILNIVIFFIMNLAGILFNWNQNLQLIIFGAKVNELIAYGQYWRMLTAMFLHIGIAHLFFNSYAIYIYGPMVESLFGKVKFIIVYLGSGLIGSLFSYMFSPNPSVGASGAIFGLMGSLLYFRKRNKNIFRQVFGPSLFMIIAVNLFFGFTSTGIDNWGHIGGLIGGYLIGNAIGMHREKVLEARKILAWLLIILLFFFGMKYGKAKYMVNFRPALPSSGDIIYNSTRQINIFNGQVQKHAASFNSQM